ncbi:MAG: SAP domain-containing protein [bacterium]|nr:SAP domain-containing protein [bacterium]
MTLTEVKKMAKNVGVKAGTMKKDELIHAIQLAEGNFDCFGKAEGSCDQEACSFRSDCLK